jgi:predicted MFS family arabinose efflux permease
MSTTDTKSLPSDESTSYWPLLLVLAAVQFVHVLDFVIIMPLAPQLMRVFDIGPQAFGFLVSVYNLAAAGAGLAGAFFLDRFDRKKALLVILAGFTISTLACGLAADTRSLMIARALTGAFGGLIQALIFAIIGDCIPENQRGTATGTVMSAFSVASVIGIPIGLSLADAHDWRMPFLVLAGVSLVCWFATFRVLPAIRSHLADIGSMKYEPATFSSVMRLVRETNSLVAFWLITSLMFAGFMVIPFISAYLVANVGLSERDLVTVFFAGGIATLLTSRVIGILADRFGKIRIFYVMATLSVVPIFLLTRLTAVSVYAAVAVTTLFTVLISARMIPALAMITSSIDKVRRGSFMSLTSSVQQAASGLASLIAGAMLGQGAKGEITRYDLVGTMAIAATFIAIYAARHLRPFKPVSVEESQGPR